MASAQTLVFPEPLITALSFLFCFCMLAPALYYVWFVYRRKLDHTGMLGGLAVYFVLNTALKLPFPKEFLSGGSTAALLVRCVRYAIVAFVDFGVYPMLFRLERRADKL